MKSIDTSYMRLSLDVRLGHFIVEQIYGQIIGFPIIFFNLDTNAAHYIRSVSEENGTSFFADEMRGYISHTNDIIEFDIISNARLGIMWPCLPAFMVYPSQSMIPASPIFTSSYHYLNNISDNQASIEIASPHFVFTKECNNFMLTTNNVSSSYSIFAYNGTNYLNIITNEWTNKLVISQDSHLRALAPKNIDVSLSNLDMTGLLAKNPVFESQVNILTSMDMRKIFYYGIQIKTKQPDHDYVETIKTVTRLIQSTFNKHDIQSAAMGSVAMNLYGIQTHIKDIDIVISSKDINKAQQSLNSIGLKTKRLNDFRITAMYDDIPIDVYSYNDVFEYLDDRQHISGIFCINIHKLTGCRLWLEIALNSMYDNTDGLKNDNDRKLIEFMQDPSFFLLHPTYLSEINKWKTRYDRLIHITQYFHDREKTDIPIKCPYPCRASTFKTDSHTLISIINLGSPRIIKLSFLGNPSNIRWVSAFIDKKITVQTYHEYSEVEIEIIDMGILIIS